MGERKYEVVDELGRVIASNMNFQIGMCLIRGYIDMLYDDKLNLTIREMDR